MLRNTALVFAGVYAWASNTVAEQNNPEFAKQDVREFATAMVFTDRPHAHKLMGALAFLVFLMIVPLSSHAGSCSGMTGLVFVTADLTEGVGLFGADAISESWTVDCPSNVVPCPPVNFPSGYTAFQAGTFQVTYTKQISGGGSDQCMYPLVIGPVGFQAELEWDWEDIPGNGSVDLDLHMHLPNNTAAWGGTEGNAVVCAWNNCTVSNYGSGTGINWFGGGTPPDPVDWHLSPVFEENACYFTPRGIGTDWQTIGMGCHNPRLDIDNVACDPSVTDPQNSQFCNPEIASIDYPPVDQWTRIGVHYFSNGGESVDIHPSVNFACRGQNVITLGPTGYDQPVAFPASEGGDLFWIVGDALFHRNPETGSSFCIIRPIFENETLMTPLILTVAEAQINVGPGYLPVTDLAVKLYRGQPVLPKGGQSRYLVEVTNNGPDDSFGARVELSLPAVLANNSWTCSADPGASCIVSGGPGLNQFFNASSGTSVRYLVTVDLPPDAPDIPVLLTVQVTPADTYVEVENSNNSDSVTGIIGMFGDGYETGIPNP